MKRELIKSAKDATQSVPDNHKPAKKTEERTHRTCPSCGKPRPLMTVEDVAAYLNLTPRCMYEIVARAKSRINPPSNPIPFRKIGSGRLRFDFDEIVEWTKSGDGSAD